MFQNQECGTQVPNIFERFGKIDSDFSEKLTNLQQSITQRSQDRDPLTLSRHWSSVARHDSAAGGA